MWIINGIVAGLVAGIIMGIVSQLGYWLGIHGSHLIIIDGEFALTKIKRNPTTLMTYITGILIHLVTSAIFGIVYVLIAKLFEFEIRTTWAIAVYVLILWLAMLLAALPIAGQGIGGKRIGNSTWLEQLILHVIFGLSFWWALGIV